MTGSEVAAWRVPGRIEVLGKHTDYAGGHVLVCAVEQGVTAVARRRPGSRLVAHSAEFADPVEVTESGPDALAAGHWGRYVATAWRRLAANFGALPGAELAISTTLPLASGMSSSSALLSGAALALADLAGLRETPTWRDHVGDDPLDWAMYLASIENGGDFGPLLGNGGVGTRGGSEDHTARFCSCPGQLGWFGFDPLARHGHVAVPHGWVFVVAVSGVSAQKTGPAQADYNRASSATREILHRWDVRTGCDDASLAAAVRSDDRALDVLGSLLTEPALFARLEQFVTESEVLVPAAVDALRRGDVEEFGEAVAHSQRLAEQSLGNQVPETVALAADARALGAPAASSFGAGFGGSVWALVRTADADAFAADWLGRYRAAFDRPAASTLVTAAAGPAERLDGADHPAEATDAPAELASPVSGC